MLTPVISFATNDTANDAPTENNETTENKDTTTGQAGSTGAEATDGIVKNKTGVDFIDKINPTAISTDGMTQEGVDTALNYLIASTADRQKVAYAKATEEPQADTSLESDDIFDASKVIDGHMFVAEAGGYELYAEPESLSILIRDKKTGTLLRSTVEDEDAYVTNSQLPSYNLATSGITVVPVKYDPTSETRSGMYDKVNTQISSRDATITYKAIEHGFIAHLHFDNHKNVAALKGLDLEFDVQVKLEDNGSINVQIPSDKIVEKKTDDAVCYLMGDVYVFPLLGYTDRGDTNGYMILPDGNGIIVNFSDFYQDGTAKYKSGYTARVYGKDVSMEIAAAEDPTKERKDLNPVEDIIAPYFGMVHDYSKFNDGSHEKDIAVLGFVEDGEYNCKINGMFNGVNASFQNYSYASATFREVYQQPTDNAGIASKTEVTENLMENFEMSFLLASGEDANYSGLANKARELLKENGTLAKAEDMAYDVRVDFIGLDKENFLLFRRNVVATTIENMKEILHMLKVSGVENISAYYDGWQKGGMYNLPNAEYNVDKDLGGNLALSDLQKSYTDGSVKISVIQDMLNINDTTANATFIAMKMINKRTYSYTDRFLEVYKTFKYLTPAKTNEYLKKLADDMLSNGQKNLTVKGFTNNLFAYSVSSKIRSRKDAMNEYTSAVESVKKEGINLSMIDPAMYLWKYTDEYLDFPISSSMYVYASEEIPFLSTVLKGSMKVYSEYVNFEANQTEFFLKLVETGVYPSFLLTYESPTNLQYTNSSWVYSSDYEKYISLITEFDTDLKSVNKMTEGACIVKHEMHYDGNADLTKVTYDNGVVVYVNYAEETVSADGVTIDGLSYKVGEE